MSLPVLQGGSLATGQPAQVTTLALTGDTLKASGALVMGPDGHLYATNFSRTPYTIITFGMDLGSEIYRINLEEGSVERFADGLNGPFDIAVDHEGDLLVTNTGLGTVNRVSPEGRVSDFVTPGSLTTGIAVADDGSVITAKCIPPGITKFFPDSTVPTFFSDANSDCPLGLRVCP